MDTPGFDPEIEQAIHDAQRRLDAFERSGTANELLFRLRQSSPLHPFLLMRGLGLWGAMFLVLCALAALAGPFMDEQVAHVVARLDAASGIPMFAVLAMLVLCSFSIALGGHFAALAAARGAPMLPHEAKQHQRLKADVQQLEAQRAVRERITPYGATPRPTRRR